MRTHTGTIHAVSVQKGGVGKSTITNALGYSYAAKGFKTAIVDLDPQASQTGAFFGFGFGSFIGDDNSNMCRIFENKSVEPIKQETLKFIENPNKGFGQKEFITEEIVIDLYPSNYQVTHKIESNEMSEENKISQVANFLNSLRSNYDRIIIDAPPSFGVLTKGIVAASDSIVVPISTKNVDSDGIVGYFKILDELVETTNNSFLKKLVVVPNMHMSNVNDSKETLKEIKTIPNLIKQQKNLRKLECIMMPPIKQTSVIQEAPSYKMFLVPYIMEYGQRSKHRELLSDLEILSNSVEI